MPKDDKISILEYYGLDIYDENILVDSNTFNDAVVPNFKAVPLNQSILKRSRCLLLMLSLDVTSATDRYLSFEKLLSKKFSINCTLLSERIEKYFSFVRKTGIVLMDLDQINQVLAILYQTQNHSFAVLMNSIPNNAMPNDYLHLFKEGILLPDTLMSCCSYALVSNSAFLHILRGFDGFSINCIYNVAYLDSCPSKLAQRTFLDTSE